MTQYYDVTGKISPSNRADTQIFNRNNDTVIANNGSGLYLALRVGNNANIPNLVISPMIRSASDSNTDYAKPILTTSSLKQSLSQLAPKAYTTSGMTLTNCTLVSGGYFKIGNVCVFNMRIKSNGGIAEINGLPNYNGLMVNAYSVPINVYCNNDFSNRLGCGYVDSTGKVTIRALTENNDYSISATYLCN